MLPPGFILTFGNITWTSANSSSQGSRNGRLNALFLLKHTGLHEAHAHICIFTTEKFFLYHNDGRVWSNRNLSSGSFSSLFLLGFWLCTLNLVLYLDQIRACALAST